jgi:NTP pyrophosphatase (non-canonical NTP hydrolase)
MDMKKLTKQIVEFRDKRDWKQFHKPKDLALSLALEAAEVMEHFQWKNDAEIAEHIKKNKAEIGDELADVLYWILLMSHDMGINLEEAFERKMKENDRKYPVEKSKGKHTKYNKL